MLCLKKSAPAQKHNRRKRPSEGTGKWHEKCLRPISPRISFTRWCSFNRFQFRLLFSRIGYKLRLTIFWPIRIRLRTKFVEEIGHSCHQHHHRGQHSHDHVLLAMQSNVCYRRCRSVWEETICQKGNCCRWTPDGNQATKQNSNLFFIYWIQVKDVCFYSNINALPRRCKLWIIQCSWMKMHLSLLFIYLLMNRFCFTPSKSQPCNFRSVDGSDIGVESTILTFVSIQFLFQFSNI